MSMVGDALQCPLPARHCPLATQAMAALGAARLAPCRGGRWAGLSGDPSPGPHGWEGGRVRGGARHRSLPLPAAAAPGPPRALTPEQQEPSGEPAGARLRARCHPAKACRLTTGTSISMEITGSNSFPLTGAV